MKIKMLVVILLLVFASACVSAFDAGSRALSMGKTYAAVSDDSAAVFWNPAGLAQIIQNDISLFGTFKDSFSATALMYAFPTENLGYFGFGAFRQANLEDNTDSGVSAAAAYSRYIIRNLSAGIALKTLNRTKNDSSGSVLGVNLGLLYKPIRNISIGLSGENISAGTFTYNNFKYKMPYSYKLGFAYYLIMWRERLDIEKYIPLEDRDSPIAGEKVLLVVDIERREGSDNLFIHRGIEFWIGNVFGFRMGPDVEETYKGNTFDALFAVNRPVIGASLKYRGSQLDLSYGKDDYPWSLTLTRRFGKKIAPPEYSKWEINKKAQQYVIAGDKYYGDGKLAQALIEWEKALVWQPENAQVQQKMDNTRKELEVVTNKKVIENYINQAYLYYEDGKLLDSLSNWEEILKLDPENLRAREYVDKILGKLTDNEKKKYSEKTEEETKLKTVEYLRKGDAYIERGKYNEAVREWERVLKLNPLHAEAKENIEKAEARILALVESNYNEGVRLFSQKEYPAAAVKFRKILELTPGHAEAKSYLDRIAAETTKKIDVKKIDQMYYTAADLYFAGKYKESTGMLDKILSVDPTNRNANKLMDKVKSIMEKLGQ